MLAPPFKTSSLFSALTAEAAPSGPVAARQGGHRARLQSPQACCAADAAPPAAAATAVARKRKRLSELNPHFHCSVIGTCLSTAELRRWVPRFKQLDRQQASDLEIHHAAVELAVEAGPGAKALHKLLDDNHALVLRRFRAVRHDDDGEDEAEAALAALWSEALRSGEVPGAYWALMTHELATPALQQRAFGDVHMLSHLVGAANRADIRRLVALERENAELKDQVERQQHRLREISVERHETVGHLSGQVVALSAQLKREAEAPGAAMLAADITLLRHSLHQRDQQLALHTSRREQAEQAAANAAGETQRLAAELAQAIHLADSLHREVRAMEQQLRGELQPAEAGNAMASWAGRRVLYVGGRPSSNAVIRGLCERAGVALMIHDGGIDDRKGLLPAAVPNSDLVLFPVDCVDHDSMNQLKRLCNRHGVPFKPLRTAGVACVVAALSDAGDTRGAARSIEGQDLPGPMCRRHA